MPSALLIDFDDSFTYNIVMYLSEKLKVEVVSFRHFVEHSRSYFNRFRYYVLGPGPGHPNDYPDMFPLVDCLLKKDHFYTLGICLGHQLIGKTLGGKVERPEHPIHGQAVPFTIPPWKIFPKAYHGQTVAVQRYNSQGIKKCPADETSRYAFESGVLMSSIGPNHLSYQFHPESVGTSCPHIFFTPFFKACYND